MSELPAGSTVEILYGRTGLRVALPGGGARDGDRQAAAAEAPRPARRGARRAGAAGRRAAVRDAGAGTQQRLHPDLRHHAAGAQPPVPAAADRGPDRRRHAARAHHRAGRDRPAPAERGRGARGAGRRPVGAGDRARREPLRARRRRARRSRRHRGAQHAGQARPPLRRGGPADRHRPRRAALHGRLLGRAQGDRAGHRARGHDPHLPQRALHGGPGGDPVQPRRQPAARGAARDRAHAGRGLRGQHGDRRGSRPRARELRRGDREPPRRGGVRRRERARAGRPALRDGAHLGRRLPARQDLLPDGQGHGDAARHPGARRHADRRLRLLGRLRLARVPRRRSGACASSAPTRSCRRCWPSASPTSTSGRPRCS